MAVKTKKGVVVSDKMSKSILVEITRLKSHRLYKKKYKISKKFLVDNPKDEYKIGDQVEIEETKPQSKKKCWRVKKKIR